MKQQIISSSYRLVLLDVKHLSTNALLERTIDIILKRMYDKHRIITTIGHKEKRYHITLSQKNLFLLLTMIHTRDSVAIRISFRTSPTRNFIVELGNFLVPKLHSYLCFLKRYVDDASTIVKE